MDIVINLDTNVMLKNLINKLLKRDKCIITHIYNRGFSVYDEFYMREPKAIEYILLGVLNVKQVNKAEYNFKDIITKFDKTDISINKNLYNITSFRIKDNIYKIIISVCSHSIIEYKIDSYEYKVKVNRELEEVLYTLSKINLDLVKEYIEYHGIFK